MADPDIVDRLQDFERHGTTATDRVRLRLDAAMEIISLRARLKLVHDNAKQARTIRHIEGRS